jgi:signal transduction histidine kinase
VHRPRHLSWTRQHPRATDAILAGFAAFTSIGALWGGSERVPNVRDPNVWGTLLAIATCVPLIWRRRAPIAVLAAVFAAEFLLEGFNFNESGVAPLIATYTLAAHTSGPRRDLTVRIAAPALGAFVMIGLATKNIGYGEAITSVLFSAGAYVLGDNLQRRRRAVAEATERAEHAERERELVARQRMHDERSRIARELHDVVAHSVSLMIIQAGAARRSMATSPTQAEAALRDLEATGRNAMTELRRVLGVLRASDPNDELQLAPQPSLAALRTLVDDAGLPVELTEIGTPPNEVPPSVGLSLYRVVQEALTNVRKHAGVVRRVTVQITYSPDNVAVQIVDDGRGASVATNVAGLGLVGMRERMALCGGSVTVGPRPGGGWHVRASAPLHLIPLESARA